MAYFMDKPAKQLKSLILLLSELDNKHKYRIMEIKLLVSKLSHGILAKKTKKKLSKISKFISLLSMITLISKFLEFTISIMVRCVENFSKSIFPCPGIHM